MLTAFRALPLVWRLLAILGVLVGILGAAGGLYAYVRQQGYVAGYADASAKCEAEKRQQQDANRKAISEAGQKLDQLSQQLDLKELQLDDDLKAIDLAAAANPAAGDQCLSADSVRRLSTIR